ncbi:DUF4097 family beta strand repeat-containing protein [Streptantibioticus rubrisoli]|uniref:DUF4097 domain-containing protein n=1 Tax=Streptantibioticus rubrisoli TaxID=1387313 RepID=A0ABT1PFX8_9ACTN|nr:DUF4097 family beta strand repeat-containing protein [Streptantibioticus rubrisoli]MCQ4044272.1 DUF4097 domain-containing protein [Streptantibioticus rubrisoli]
MIRRPVILLFGAAVLLSACSGPAPEKHRTVSYGVRDSVRKLVIQGHTGNVRVTGGGSTVSVTERQNYQSAPPHTTHTTADGTLTLTYDCQDCGVDYDVRVPTGTAVSVTANTGDVTISAMGGLVTASTDTGSVTGDRLASGQAHLTSETGDVRATFDHTPSTVYATSQTGSVHVTVPRGTPYAVQASAQTGKVSVDVTRDDHSPHTITAKAETGDVTVRAV